jgi:hypothetical protein
LMFVWSAAIYLEGQRGVPGPQNRVAFVGAEVPRKFCGNPKTYTLSRKVGGPLENRHKICLWRMLMVLDNFL